MHHRILKTAPNIVEARIIIGDDEEPWPESNGEFIDMLPLHRLYVSDPEVFDYIRAPAFAELSMYVEPDSQIEHLDSFLACSSCALRRLCLRGSPDSDITATILNKHLSITSFALAPSAPHGQDDDDPDVVATTVNKHITMLTVDSPNCPVVAPHLCEMSFGSLASMSVDYHLFLEMLESRHRAADCALSTAAFLTEFGRSRPRVPAILDRIEELRKRGLRVHVESGSEAAYTVNCWAYVCPWISVM
ncbi:hypothetical protein FB45DRAFT_490416 [Roridomyces roridus]|uniref:Uncharacterized protein n=1 Tax=Roridomyces roridus TaxID=1738132 RepID=A0AAD7AZJ7_9AGAR|nr:hypothetical protein FB45DRAFT_490416 [Roridomyces roridus]